MYKEKLKLLPFNLYVYIVDSKSLEALGRTFPERELSNFQLQNPHKKDVEPSFNGKLDLELPEMKLAIDSVKRNLLTDASSVHFIMGDNYSADWQISPTPWIIVHRLIHAFGAMARLNE